MKYLFTIISGVFSVAIFAVAASIATSPFENVIVAGMGFIYVSLRVILIFLAQNIANSNSGLMRLMLVVIEMSAKPEHDIDITGPRNDLDISDKSIDLQSRLNGIEFIFYIIISLGSLYLVFKSINV